MSEQLEVFGPYPATVREREAAIALAFRERAPARIAATRAARVPCIPVCGEPIGRPCAQAGPAGSARRVVRQRPHPARLAFAVRCPVHKAAPGVACLPAVVVCEERVALVKDEAAALAQEAVGRARRPGSARADLDSWMRERHPGTAAEVDLAATQTASS